MIAEGVRIGHIRISHRLGHGGMGEVWEAVDEQLGRHVAVKTLRRRLGSEGAEARLAREARILSRFEHPNVCRLYEYISLDQTDLLVMELVRGRTVRELIERGASAAERLHVALGICSALVAAHALSIVHRDLKPENAMIAEDGTVKVLDFGIARRIQAEENHPAVRHVAVTAAEQGDTAPPSAGGQTTVALLWEAGTSGSLDVTRPGDVVGTPRYMSPEQARGEAATAASDMFSFGLLLHELYTGAPPYRADSDAELLRRAQWGDVPPTTGIDRSIAALIGDLTALDPRNRLTAVGALARLRRVQNRPIRRLRLAAAAVAVAGLVVGTGLSLVGLERARSEAATADATTDFVVSLFQAADPQEAANPEVRARDVLDRGVARIRQELADQPATRARLLSTLGAIYGNLGVHDQALPLLDEALALQERQTGANSAELLPMLTALANEKSGAGDFSAAEKDALRAVTIATAHGRSEWQARALGIYSRALQQQGRMEEAEAAGRRALVAWQAEKGPEHRMTAATLANLALIEIDRGRFSTAEPMLTRALEVLEARLGPQHFEVAQVVNNLATARKELGRYAEAEALYRRSLALLEQRVGPDHPQCAIVHNDLAVVLLDQKRVEEAESHYRSALAIAEKALGAAHPVTAIFAGNLGETYSLQGRLEDAEQMYRRSLRDLERALGREHRAVAESLRGYGVVCAALGRSDQAEELLTEAVGIRERVDGVDHPDFARALVELGRLQLSLGRLPEARATLGRAVAILESALGASHPTTIDVQALLGQTTPE